MVADRYEPSGSLVVPVSVPATAAGRMGSDLAAEPGRWTRRWSEAELEALFDLVTELDVDDLSWVIDDEWVDGVVASANGGAGAGAGAGASAGGKAGSALAALLRLVDGIRADLLDGPGFVLLKGYPVGEVDRRTEAFGFLVMGRLLGRLRSQNAAGHLLGHVKDVGGDAADPTVRIYQTNERQTFHTDSVDAVGLLCRRPAVSGGRSLLASAETAYRLVAERRPDLAPWLFAPLATDRRGEVPEGADPWFEIPVLSWFEGRLTVLYQRTYIDSAARFAAAPRLAPEQVEALDLWDEVLNEPGVALAMDLEPGDIQFVHNHSLLHDRTGFVDDPDPALRRHLLRLWVSLPGDRPLPPVFTQRYGSIEVGARGGITVPGTSYSVPLDV